MCGQLVAQAYYNEIYIWRYCMNDADGRQGEWQVLAEKLAQDNKKEIMEDLHDWHV